MHVFILLVLIFILGPLYLIACWLIDQVIREGTAADIRTASADLFEQSSISVQEASNGVLIVLPDCLEDNWDDNWPTDMTGRAAAPRRSSQLGQEAVRGCSDERDQARGMGRVLQRP
jgi:hypothetical protein